MIKETQRVYAIIYINIANLSLFFWKLIPDMLFTGILGPWIESSNDFSNVEKFGAKLRDHNSTLEVNRSGMYMIYAQVSL